MTHLSPARQEMPEMPERIDERIDYPELVRLAKRRGNPLWRAWYWLSGGLWRWYVGLVAEIRGGER